MAGVTFLAFGNGSPDVFSTFAAMSSHSGSLAVGELIGAAGFITAVVAGSMALVREFKVGKKTFVRDVGFFIVAASFSMGFLADGSLHLWECCVMVGFYVFYVIVVVVWHWYLTQHRRRREREAAARGQYLAVTNEEVEVTEEDGDEEDSTPGERRYRDAEDFGALERGSPAFSPQVDEGSDEDGDEGITLATEMANSMRVLRPSRGRRNTITPIRPSLVGALEFRSVLSSLQKARGSHARPIHLRRYSDDPTGSQSGVPVFQPNPYSDNNSSVIITPSEGSVDLAGATPSVRTRAVSLNDAVSMQLDPASFRVATVPNIGIVAATPTYPLNFDPSSLSPNPGLHTAPGPIPPSPKFSLSPPPSTNASRDPSPSPGHERHQRDTLALPVEGYPGARHLRADFFKYHDTVAYSPNDSPRTTSRERPRLQIPGPTSRDSSRSHTLSPVTQFPTFTDSPLPMSAVSSKSPSIVLPPPILKIQVAIYTSRRDPSDGGRIVIFQARTRLLQPCFQHCTIGAIKLGGIKSLVLSQPLLYLFLPLPSRLWTGIAKKRNRRYPLMTE